MKKWLDLLLMLPLVLALLFFGAWTRITDDWLSGTAWASMLPESASLFTSAASPKTVNNYSAPAPASTSMPTHTEMPASASTITTAIAATSTPVKIATRTPTEAPVDVEIDTGIARGTLIVQAIEKYYRDQHYYPPILADLVPVYLPELPVTTTDQPYFYREFERTGAMASEIYWVSFRVTSEDHVTCTFFRRIQFWDCSFASP